EEDILRRPCGDQVDQLALECIRVLELVDNDRAEAELLDLAYACVVREQVAREQLEVLEVERGLALLPGRILDCEQAEQLLEQPALAERDELESRLLELLACLLVGRRPHALRAECLELDEPLGLEREVERVVRGS